MKVKSYRQRNLKPAHPSSLVIALLLKNPSAQPISPPTTPIFRIPPPPLRPSVRAFSLERTGGWTDPELPSGENFPGQHGGRQGREFLHLFFSARVSSTTPRSGIVASARRFASSSMCV